MKHRLIEIIRFIYCLFLTITLISFSSCYAQKNKRIHTVKVGLLTDSILTPYMYFNEIVVTSENNNLLKNIQSLSENKSLNSIKPEERIRKKIELYNFCKEANLSDCNYTPESYKVLSKTYNILNIEYAYNAYSNPDEYFKYATFNLITGERITYNKIFKNPPKILNDYNSKYTSEIKSYLKKLNTNDEEELDEYNLYKEHLETRNSFKLEDLNNLEIIYDPIKGKVTQLKFHYNGQGGYYRQYLQKGFIDFNIEELRPYLTDEFKKQLEI